MTETICVPQAVLFERLRLETGPWHERIEQDLDLLRPGLTRLEYGRLLARFYGFYQPWEARIGPAVRSLIPSLLERRHKTALLEDDMRSLGWTDGDIRGIARCEDLPDIASEPEILGSFYVVEGATLGGPILARHLASRLNLENGGCRLFSGYGADTSRKWKEFRRLTESRSGPEQNDRIVLSAREMFASMHRWLCVKDLSVR